MRKRIMLIILGLVLLLLVLLHCGKNDIEQSVNAQMDGIMIAQSGEWNEISIQITGTYIEQPRGNTDMDQFHFGEDGGIWIGETRLDISGIPFGNDASDYAYLEFNGNTIVINREADLFIGPVAKRKFCSRPFLRPEVVADVNILRITYYTKSFYA